ncbi:hypothetical protein FB567DRAFT_587537 [Paraphoma chrysanthemicola]|uniref:Uncharacterized protein n=1 Tax=Paraphoma chrysanthemicola TaxID=798071 RepID=A0A8K0REL0_9PLEO|nr:hypothetical protein FB567DRAFT_587537 [Paraphoma chrysanthemicola]
MADFNSLSRAQKRAIIQAEDHSDGQPQITMSPEAVDALQAALSSTPKHRLHESYSSAMSLNIINENWGVDMSTFPLSHHGRDFRRVGDLRNKKEEMWVEETDVKRFIKDLLQPLRDPEAEELVAARKRKTKYDARKKKVKGGEDAELEDELDGIIMDGAQKALEGVQMEDKMDGDE